MRAVSATLEGGGDCETGAWPTLLATTEVSLLAADLQASAGDGDAVIRLLALARAEARRDLAALDRWFLVWPEWTRFEERCHLAGWARWVPIGALLRRRVESACLAFVQLLAKAERTCSDVAPEPNLGDALEDLLVEVWRCERDWRLDDRIEASLRSRGRPE